MKRVYTPERKEVETSSPFKHNKIIILKLMD